MPQLEIRLINLFLQPVSTGRSFHLNADTQRSQSGSLGSQSLGKADGINVIVFIQPTRIALIDVDTLIDPAPHLIRTDRFYIEFIHCFALGEHGEPSPYPVK
jgi:hypothetical protein